MLPQEISTEEDSSCFINGVTYDGNPIAENSNTPTFTNVNTPEECQVKCQEWPNDECKFFTWNSDSVPKNKNTCWLKSQKGIGKPKLGKMAGPKFCPSSTSSKF